VNNLSRSTSPAAAGSDDPTSVDEGLAGLDIPDFSTGSLAPGAWMGLTTTAENRTGQPLPGRRFAALSSLPADRRLPAKRENIPPRASPPPTTELAPPAPLPPPVMLPSAESRQMGFNCPSCFSVLIIKDPSSYDGRPAPCPSCGIRILPPQRVPDSPFSIVHRSSPPALPLLEG
jgi:DNA-directed RNA polymerase subunit RPC12/RpoP